VAGACKGYLILCNNVAVSSVEVLAFHIFLVGDEAFIDHSEFSMEYLHCLSYGCDCLHVSLEVDVDIGKTNNLSDLCDPL
jgi:hypothetical protein